MFAIMTERIIKKNDLDKNLINEQGIEKQGKLNNNDNDNNNNNNNTNNK